MPGDQVPSSPTILPRFSAVSIPLIGSVRLDLRGAGVIDSCVTVPGLPSSWQGLPSKHGSFEVFADQRGFIRVRVRENSEIVWSVLGETKQERGDVCSAFITPEKLFKRTSRTDLAASGIFKCVNYLGRLDVTLSVGGKIFRLYFEIASTKFSDERDFEIMTAHIADQVQQLLLQANAPTWVPLTVDAERQASLNLERFLLLRQLIGDGKIQLLIAAILRHAHSKLSASDSWQPAPRFQSDSFLRDPFRNGRGWQRIGAALRPAEVQVTRKRVTADTEENRFVAFVLRDFQAVCLSVASATASQRGEIGEEATQLARSIEDCLSMSFFRELSPISRIPLDSQVLQRRAGYRELLSAWLLSSQATRLEWDGRAEILGGPVRNVATLYEYWLFFELRALIKDTVGVRAVTPTCPSPLQSIVQSDGIVNVRLRRGRTSVCSYEIGASDTSRLRLNLWFDRTFSPTRDVLAGGTYSRHFRPDFTFAVFPAEYAIDSDESESERVAEAAGHISYLHFDAKYRNDRIDQLFGIGDESDLVREDEESVASVYRRADLYKMHTYNDAIRRTVGSFVLYPGSARSETRFDKYHEIVPGVGAFAFSPSDPRRRDALGRFLGDFFVQQSHRFSQQARLQFWTHDTVRENPKVRYFPGSIQTKTPAKDESILLGFVRSRESLEDYRLRRVFFIHAIEWKAGKRQPGRATELDFDPLKANTLALFQGGFTAPWLARVDRVSLVSAEERALELGRPLASMRSAYYFRFSFERSYSSPSRDVSGLVGRRVGIPLLITAAQLSECKTK